MVSDGFTPRFAVTAAPSTTCSPGCPYTRWYASTTPWSGSSPMTQPPMKCAVSGMLSSSPHDPPGQPSTFAAALLTTSLAAGIQVGFGLPWPCLDVSFHLPNQLRLGYTV